MRIRIVLEGDDADVEECLSIGDTVWIQYDEDSFEMVGGPLTVVTSENIPEPEPALECDICGKPATRNNEWADALCQPCYDGQATKEPDARDADMQAEAGRYEELRKRNEQADDAPPRFPGSTTERGVSIVAPGQAARGIL